MMRQRRHAAGGQGGHPAAPPDERPARRRRMNARRVTAAGMAALPGAGRGSGGGAGPLERGAGAGGVGCWWGGAQSAAAGIGWVLVLPQPGVVAHPIDLRSRVRGDSVGRMPVLSHGWPTRRVSWSAWTWWRRRRRSVAAKSTASMCAAPAPICAAPTWKSFGDRSRS